MFNRYDHHSSDEIFVDQSKEQAFRQYNDQTLYPFTNLLLIGGIIFSIIQIIICISFEITGWTLIFPIINLVSYMMLGVLIRKRKNLCQITITMLTIYLNIINMISVPNQDKQSILFGTFLITSLNCFIIFFSDFMHCILQIIGLVTSSFLAIQQNFQPQLIQILPYYIIIITTFIVYSYQHCKQLRGTFLLTEKENLWVNLLQYLCDNPFIVITLDNVNLQYKIVNSNKIEDQSFLKNCNYQQTTLQNYIYQTQKNFNLINGLVKDEYLIVSLNKQDIKVRVTFYCMEKIYVFVQIISDQQRVQNLKETNQQIDNMLQQMILQLIKLLPSALKSKQNLLKLKLALMELYYRRFQSIKRKFNISKLISKQIKYFNKNSLKIQFQCNQNIQIYGYYYLYSLLIMRILYSKSKIGLIKLQNDDQGTHLIFYGDISLKFDNLVHQCIQQMKINIEVQKNYVKITQTDIEYNNEYYDFCEANVLYNRNYIL
ncbi:hypothetical protein pb186bvf_016888 [Paramecium bursaria]